MSTVIRKPIRYQRKFKDKVPEHEIALNINPNVGIELPWKDYLRYNDIVEFLEKLHQAYPEITKVISIGQTHEQRSIILFRISNRRLKNRAIWLESGIHAREWICPATSLYIIYQLVTRFHLYLKFLREIDWYIVPVLNPDGYEYSHTNYRMCRKNRRITGATTERKEGVDLNRNFGYKWGKVGSSSIAAKNIYRGPKAFSEPETAAVRDFIEKNNSIKWTGYLALHSHAKKIMYSWAYTNELPKDWRELDAIGRKMSRAIKMIEGTIYDVGPIHRFFPASGGSSDWAKGSGIFKYAFTVELKSKNSSGFKMPSQFILPIAKEAFAAVSVLAEAIDAGRLVRFW